MIEPGALILLLLLGTWAALDGVSVAQVMVSRPLISGILAGAIVGAPEVGLIVGAILEAAHIGQLPVGTVRLPEPGPAAVPAVFAAVLVGGAGGLAFGVGVGTAWSLLGGMSMVGLRHLNGTLVLGIEEGRLSARSVAIRHWTAVGLDGLRGLLLTAAGIAAAIALSRPVTGRWGLDDPTTVALLVLPGALGAGMLLRTWSLTRRRSTLFVAGLLAGWVASELLG